MSKNAATISMPLSLWDEVIDSIATDVERMTGEDLFRSGGNWVTVRRGRGRTMKAAVSGEAAAYIAKYLRSRVGLHVGYDEGKAAARRSEGDGLKVARAIESN